MSHDLKLFFLFYGLSMIPWSLAFFFKNRDSQWALALVDFALTMLAYYHLWGAIGWWLVLVILSLACVASMLEEVGIKPYDNLKNR